MEHIEERENYYIQRTLFTAQDGDVREHFGVGDIFHVNGHKYMISRHSGFTSYDEAARWIAARR